MVKKVIYKETKVKRVDKNLNIKKTVTKSELELQVKNLQKTNGDFEESVKRLQSLKAWKKRWKMSLWFLKKLKQSPTLILSLMNATLKRSMEKN